jgi:hypothetical protein
VVGVEGASLEGDDVVGVIVFGDKDVGASGEVAGVAVVSFKGASVLGACVIGDRVVGDKVYLEKKVVEGAGFGGGWC